LQRGSVWVIDLSNPETTWGLEETRRRSCQV